MRRTSRAASGETGTFMSDQPTADRLTGPAATSGDDLAVAAPELPRPQIREVTAHSIAGGLALLLTVLGVALGVGAIAVGGILADGGNKAAGIPLILAGGIILLG